MKKIYAILLLTLFSISGCAVFEGGNLEKANLPVSKITESGKVTLSYKAIAIDDGISSQTPLPEAGQSIITGELLAVLEETGYFSRIAKNDSSAETRIDMSLVHSSCPAAVIPAIITGLSFYTIPSWATNNFEVTVKAEGRRGLSKEYVFRDSTILVQWLPMIFFAPIYNPSIAPEVRKNIYKKVLLEMQNDGFFSDI